MSAGMEPAPDQALAEALGRKVFDLLHAHVEVWGNGNKPHAEAVMALGFAFGGLVENYDDRHADLMTQVLLGTAKWWSHQLKETRGRVPRG